MDSKELLKFCLERGLLVDEEILSLFSGEDGESAKLIIEKIGRQTQKKIITKDLFYDNKEQVNRFFADLPEESQKRLENLKIKLGLSIEISKSVAPVQEKIEPLDLFTDPRVKVLSMNCHLARKFEVGDFVGSFRDRFLEMKKILQERQELGNLVSIDKLSGARQGVSLIGMVVDKRTTKNKNLILDVEDLTGSARILVNQTKDELYKKAEDIPLDSVLGFKCSGNREILFANDIVFPDAKLFGRKKSPIEEYVLFIGDIHFGSKNFLEDNFLRFLDYLKGKIPGTPEVSKIKYLFILGDLVTGIGNYPRQEEDLKIVNLEDQFVGISDYLNKIRKDIKIIISPGNHEGVRLMEPQPLYDEKYAWPLYDMSNVTLTENPALVNIASRKNFSGFDVLTYHGFSYPFYANNITKLMKAKAMNCPERIMEYLLRLRHLAPTHGSVQYFPCDRDSHIIRKIPDIFVSGHTHKSAVTYYNNILLISASSWESFTSYQEKFGNVPDHCKVPMLNLKTRAVKILDFE